MIPKAHIVHQAPNRLRLKLADKKEDGEYLKEIPGKFTGFKGVDEIEINPRTGSVLFKHGGNSDEIIEFIKKGDILDITVKSAHNKSVHYGVSSIYKSIDDLIHSFSNGGTNAGGVAFLALVAYGVMQISRGNVRGPAWYTAFWYALNILLKSQPEEAAADLEAE